jgi:hypothetical protein
METRPPTNAGLYVLLWLTALLAAAASVSAVLFAVPSEAQRLTWNELLRSCPACIAAAVLAPLLVAALATFLIARRGPATGEATSKAAPDRAVPAPQEEDRSALVLLGLLQREGRFLDFLAEDLAPYSDAQIGAAARAIHAGCRKALEGRVELEPVLPGEEGQEVTLDAAPDPSRIRLAGNVTGSGPYRGVLRHPGWKVRRLELPEPLPGSSRELLAPAEVDLP